MHTTIGRVLIRSSTGALPHIEVSEERKKCELSLNKKEVHTEIMKRKREKKKETTTNATCFFIE